MKIATYNFLEDNEIVHVRIDKEFKKKIKERIISKYRSLARYNRQRQNVCYRTLQLNLTKHKYFKLKRLLKIAKDVEIPKKEVLSHIQVFYAKGSKTRRELILPRELFIDEQFAEGYALYLAEGDNGANGKTIPRKVRLTNSKLSVIKTFQNWLTKYFPENNYYILVRIPEYRIFTKEHRSYLKEYFSLENSQIKTQICRWKRIKGFVYKICCDQAILIDLILAIEDTVKSACLKDPKLASAYIRGMMIGEGTVYFNRSRYVRIEMRNEKEIKYLHKLFQLLGYSCAPSLRNDNSDRWSLYIGAKQLKKYYDEIGFGSHVSRQKILEAAVNKRLRVNQFV